MVLISILTVGLCGCDKKHTYKIGVSQCSSDDWREKMNGEIMREAMLHDDIVVEIRSADDSNEKQIADLKYFTDNDFDVIIAAPNEASALTPVIADIHKKGIPVIVFDRNIKGDTYTQRIGVDNIGIGEAAAQYATNLVDGQVKALEIYGLPGSTPADDRHKGFAEEINKKGGVLLGSAVANWKKENSIPVTDSLLKAYPEANLIFAHNDRMAIGASEAAKAAGRDDIKIIGIDAAPEIGIQAVADNEIDATFLYPTEGHRIIREAIKIVKDEPFEKEISFPLSSAVDSTNADILLLQNETLLEDTNKVKLLKSQLDDYWAKHTAQTFLFYAIIAILILLFILLFVTLRSFWEQRRHRELLIAKNHQLEEERDKQKELNQKLEEATQSKLMFFTNVSHDLRTPLTLIAEPVSRLSGASNLDNSQKVLMKIADKNVRILHRLINQILDFRKYENGKLGLNLSEVDFDEAIKGWAESFEETARKKSIKLALKPFNNNQKPLKLAIDVEKIERVFFNLLSNALKYSSANDSVTISYGMEGEELVFRVTDTGRGISAEDIKNIFDRFYTVDRVHPNGSGIGLSVAKAFVELHGGSVGVESEMGEGSEFTVRLPLRHVDESSKQPEKKIESKDIESELQDISGEISFADNKPLLLIIDDNSDIRQLVSELMTSEYNIVTASDGTSGIRKAMKYVPDLIICDVMMPGMDGLECCRRLKEETSTSHIPVLMLTACSRDEERVLGYESGADGYLSKPFSTEVLRSRASSLVANRRRIKEVWNVPEITRNQDIHEGRNVRPGEKDIDSEFYERFLTLFESKMGIPDISVESLASDMGLERTQFYRKIKSLTNYSPVELMRNLRLRKARVLISTTDKTISEIGYEVGFSTPAYFTKCYREMFGETPSETRNSMN